MNFVPFKNVDVRLTCGGLQRQIEIGRAIDFANLSAAPPDSYPWIV